MNPKKGDKKIKEKTPMDSGTFKLVAILILAVGFTVGAGFGVFNFDFGSFSDNSAVAIVNDTAFPDVKEVQINATDVNSTYDNSSGSNVDYPSDSGSDSGSNVPSGDTPSSDPEPPQQNPTPT